MNDSPVQLDSVRTMPHGTQSDSGGAFLDCILKSHLFEKQVLAPLRTAQIANSASVYAVRFETVHPQECCIFGRGHENIYLLRGWSFLQKCLCFELAEIATNRNFDNPLTSPASFEGRLQHWGAHFRRTPGDTTFPMLGKQ
jgi:hypothetical protein